MRRAAPSASAAGRAGRVTACGVLLALLAAPAPIPAAAGSISVHCRFACGLSAIYIMEPVGATVRRVDLRVPRAGRLEAAPEEYRFVFEHGDNAFRTEVVIDRATGNVRRVFGPREQMARMPAGNAQLPRLVYDSGQCRAQSGSLHRDS